MNKGTIKTVLLFCVLVLCIGIAIALATDMDEEGKEGEVGSHTHNEYLEKAGGTLIGDIYAPNLYVGGVIQGIGSGLTDLNASRITNGTLDIARLPSNINADTLDGLDSTGFALTAHNHDSRYYTKTESDGKYALIMHTHPPGDADTLDGLDSTVFAMAVHNHDDRYYTKTEAYNTFLGLTGGTLIGDLSLPNIYASGVINGDGGNITNLNASYLSHGIISPERGVIPSGCIVMWSGSIANIPTGWTLCDGNNGTPDLRDRFVVGAGSGYSIGDTGGESFHTLTIEEMPPHNHNTRWYSGGGLGAPSSGSDGEDSGRVDPSTSTGGGQPHENRPPYYALAYIMKL